MRWWSRVRSRARSYMDHVCTRVPLIAGSHGFSRRVSPVVRDPVVLDPVVAGGPVRDIGTAVIG